MIRSTILRMVEGGIEHFAIIGVLISPNQECRYCQRWTLILDDHGVNLSDKHFGLIGGQKGSFWATMGIRKGIQAVQNTSNQWGQPIQGI